MQLHVQADGMKLKNLVRGLIVVLLFTNCFVTLIQFEEDIVNAEVLPKFYVDDNYDSSTNGWQVTHFDTIQNAINASSAGDRILVYSGTYTENLRIPPSKTNLDLFGEDKDITTIIGVSSSNKDVIWVNATGVDISSLSIKRSGSLSNNSVIKVDAGSCTITDCEITLGKIGIFLSNCDNNKIYYNTITGYASNSGNGIYLNNSDDNTITYNTITSNYNGIFADNSSSNTISNCAIKSNTQNGLFLNATCNSNTISNNNLSSNTLNGIFLSDICNSNTISNNQIHSNSNSGIRLENSSSNTLQTNTANTNTDYGIMIVGSSNTVQYCNVYSNSKHGIFLFGDNDNDILDNTLQNNTLDGIRLHNSTSDNITRNKIQGNSQYGIHLNYYSVSNLVYNNYFKENINNNALDVSEDNNIWKRTKTLGTNIINGSYISGNYWDDYDEISEGAIDSNSDGIADSARSITISSSDSGSILDTVNPWVRTPSVSPSSQAVGSNTYISCIVTDNDTDIKSVYLSVTDPNGVVSNFSILANKTGNTYYCDKSYSTIGNYTFFIAAKDTRNWASSTSGSFYIHKGTPPSVTDNSPTTGSPYTSFSFNATITAGQTSASDLTVYVIWNHSSNNGNDSMANTGSNYFEKTVTLAKSTQSLTYSIFAKDKWGNTVTTATKTVSIVDSQAPTITIERYGPSFNDLPNSHTFAATVTDAGKISQVYIEYWYDISTTKTVEGENNETIEETVTETVDKMTADMENTATNYYKKVITPQGTPDKIYCVIYAKDASGNIANTKSPYANTGGPYTGVITREIKFNGSESFDLDGEIALYSWDFGDGITGEGVNPTHAYLTNEIYNVTLTVTDADGNTNTDTTTATVSTFSQQTASATTISSLESRYGINLTNQFYAYDADGDGDADTFVDPNNVLKVEHGGNISVNNRVAFLLSVNSNLDKVFIWDVEADSITNISHKQGTIVDEAIDENAGVRTITVSVDKSNWIYMEIADNHPSISGLTVKKSDGTYIHSDMFWRKNGKIYVVDDPDTTYYLVYPYTPAPLVLNHAIFTPESGSTINQDNPTITFSYNEPVTIDYVDFYNSETYEGVKTEDGTLILETTDNMTFSFTPPSDLANGQII